MNVESARIECDEDGFHLILEGDLVASVGRGPLNCDRLNLRLGHDAALELMREADEKIGGWWREGEAVRADHRHYRRTGERPGYVRDLDDAIALDEGGRLAEAGDLMRKREREEGLGAHLREAREVEQHQEDKHGR